MSTHRACGRGELRAARTKLVFQFIREKGSVRLNELSLDSWIIFLSNHSHSISEDQAEEALDDLAWLGLLKVTATSEGIRVTVAEGYRLCQEL